MKITKTGVLSILALFGFSGAAFATGNGIPSGPRYNLEVIAKKKCPSESLKDTNRHVIFLLANYSDPNVVGSTRLTLDMTNKVKLAEGAFNVADGNACDGDGATFRLPANPFTCAPDDLACDDPTFQKYNVYLKPVGKPGTGMKITTCAFEAGADGVLGTDDDTAICSAESAVAVRSKGKPSGTDVTKQLTTISVDIDGDGDLDRIGLFDPRLVDYFWSFDTQGQAHIQLIFIAVGA